jgi:hypothetical protein
MANGKMRRKLTALVYSKRKLNKGMVTAYKGYQEVKDVLNGYGKMEFRNKKR